MVNALPIIKIDSKEYYVDERLSEIRNVNNPHDRDFVDPEIIGFWKRCNIKEL